jgi:hypothetical protein
MVFKALGFTRFSAANRSMTPMKSNACVCVCVCVWGGGGQVEIQADPYQRAPWASRDVTTCTHTNDYCEAA